MYKIFFIFILVLISCSKESIAQFENLVWSDEFDYTGLPSETKWNYEIGYVRNNEKQYYTEKRLENARVENGYLIIEAKKEKYKDFEYTSASLITKNKEEWQYGRIEVKAKLPTGYGMWPAIWMLGKNISEVGWPTCGEIDIMENVGFDPLVIHANIHTKAYNHVKGTNKGNKITVEDPSKDFHIYAVNWSKEKMEFFVDDNLYFTFYNENKTTAEWPFDQPFYLILNIAVGGGWGGQKGIDDSIFPQQMIIDYVRVYE